jgi:SAM-dependent methyltransferase
MLVMGNTSTQSYIIKKIAAKLLTMFKKFLKFFPEYYKFKKLALDDGRFDISWKNLYPILGEDTSDTGFDRHYVYHTSWAARKLKEINPKKHIDISSSLYFAGIASAFINIEFYDYRPADLYLSNFDSKRGDLLNLPFPDNSIDSISCMHVVEHIGLGRYGDPLDAKGDLKAIEQLIRVLALGGSLLFVVPIGNPRIAFNAHRIYTKDQILSYFDELELKEIALVPDDKKLGGMINNPNDEILQSQSYGCGCFWFVKPLISNR